MAQDIDRAKVMDRVRKLMAIAEHERSDPNEAASAANMAEKIMRKYQMEYAEVIMATLKKGDDLSTGDYVASAKTNGTPVKKVPEWAGYIAVAVAKLNDCGVRSELMGSKVLQVGTRFFGYSADVEISVYMMAYLCETVIRLCNQYKSTADYERNGRTALNSYRHGVAIGVVNMLNTMAKEKEAKATRTPTGTSLVIVKQAAITEKYGDFGYVTNKKSSTKQGNAFALGFIAGRSVKMTGAIQSSGTTTGRLTNKG